MAIEMADQTRSFLQACLLGGGLGMLYDVFRITRVAFPLPRWAVLVEDMLFFALCAVSTFLFLLETGDGQLRWYVLAGLALGALVYWATLGSLVMEAAKAIIKVVSAVLGRVLGWILRPLSRLFTLLRRLGGKMSARARLRTVKIRNRLKINLKTPFRLLYNKLCRNQSGRGPKT